MYLIIDFGLTKLANKVKKNAWEKDIIDKGVSRLKRRKLSLEIDKLRTGRSLGIRKSGNPFWTGDNRYLKRNSDRRLPALMRKAKSGENMPRSIVEKEMIPDTKNYTDIRKVDDNALSDSGYMGFKNTPNSFHEEAVPLIKTGKKIKVKPRVYY